MKLDELKIVRAALGTNPDPMASKARMIVNGYISQLEGKANQAKNDFAHYASHYGLRPDQLGKVFKCQGTLYRITGLVPSRPRFPISAERVHDGRGFKFPASPEVRSAA